MKIFFTIIFILTIVGQSLQMPVEDDQNTNDETRFLDSFNVQEPNTEPVVLEKDTGPLLIEEDEAMDVAETHIFLPKFTYQAIEAKRRRVRLSEQNSKTNATSSLNANNG